MKKGRKTIISHTGQANQSIDMDPFSTSILDQLIQTQSQWKNVQDIVKLSFRAVADLVNLHGGSMKDIKNLLTTRASKTQLTTGLSLKANITDLSRAVTQLSEGIQTKCSFNDLQTVLRQYVKRDDMQQVLVSRHKSQQSQNFIRKQKSRIQTQQMQITILQARMDQFQKQISKMVAGCVTLKEFQQLANAMQEKVSAAQINEALQSKVSKHYLQTCLQKKINKNQIDEYISKKADTSDLEYIISSLQNKASITTLEKLTQVLENKADKSDLTLLSSERLDRFQMQDQIVRQKQKDRQEKARVVFQAFAREVRHQIDKNKISFQSQITLLRNELQVQFKNSQNAATLRIKEINRELDQLRTQITNIRQQIEGSSIRSSESFSKELFHQINLRKKCEQKMYEEIDEVKRKIQQIGSSTIKKRQFSEFKSNIDSIIEERISTDQIQTAFNKLEASLNQKFAYEKEETLTLLNNIQKSLGQAITLNSADIAHLNQISSRKQQKFDSNLVEEIARKTRKEVQQCRRTVDTLYTELQGKLNISEYQGDLIEIKKRFDSMNRDLNLKANIKDVCILADSKPNIDDVNKALRQLNQALDQRISENDLRVILKDQAAINETLCSQNIVGRWLWQSGQLKPGGLIPWQIECANTVPDHFFWEKDKTSILILSSGIYEITACLFCKTGLPSIFVNGQLITVKNQDSASVKKNAKKKKQKQITGSRIQQCINLPSRSRISVNSPTQGIQGFINIKRL